MHQKQNLGQLKIRQLENGGVVRRAPEVEN